MKKLLSVLALVIVCLSVNAQYSTPRWGTASNQDNTGRKLTFKKVSSSDATGVDTLALTPNASYTYVAIAANDSLLIKATETNAHYGDEIVFTVTNDAGSGNKLEFSTSDFALATSGKISLTASKRSIIVFTYDGTIWVEKIRTIGT